MDPPLKLRSFLPVINYLPNLNTLKIYLTYVRWEFRGISNYQDHHHCLVYTGGDPRKTESNKQMLRYIWDKFAETFARKEYRGIVEKYFKVGLYDFTEDGYLS